MTAYKTVCHTKSFNLFMDDAFYAAYICDDTAWLTDLFQKFKIL